MGIWDPNYPNQNC